VANTIANITTPIVDGDHVFVSTGYGTGSALLRLEKSEAGVAAREVYFLDADTLQRLQRAGILRSARRFNFNDEQTWSLLVLDRFLQP
jgi:hypothetical protein